MTPKLVPWQATILTPNFFFVLWIIRSPFPACRCHQTFVSEKTAATSEYGFQFSSDELNFLFGRSTNLPQYEVLNLPAAILPSRQKRWSGPPQAFNQSLHLDLKLLGSSFSMELQSNRHLVTPSVRLIKRLENGTQTEIPGNDVVQPHCYYHGKVRRSDSTAVGFGGVAALELCNGYVCYLPVLMGVIKTSEEHLVIRPIPTRLSKRSALANQPHLVYKKDLVHQAPYICQSYQDPGLAAERAEMHERLQNQGHISNNRTPTVEMAIFVDHELYQLALSSFPRDADVQTVQRVLTIANAVQALFYHSSLKRPVNLPITRLEILNADVKGLQHTRNVDKYLTNFCKWQKDLNVQSDADLQHWDHAVLLTGLDLYIRGADNSKDNRVVGLAPLAGMCIPSGSCTINEGRHFEAVYVMAHEIGHSLGMRHDSSPYNKCDPQSYIMSASLGGGKTSWSACSQDYLEAFLNSSQSWCLWDQNRTLAYASEALRPELPGQRYTADQQCKLRYGEESLQSRQRPLQDSCHDLVCTRRPFEEDAYAHPALEGTTCGNGKWCRGGSCVWMTMIDIGGLWGSWSPYSGCSSGCLRTDFGQEHTLKGIQVSTRQCLKPGYQGKCQGMSRRYRLCEADAVCISAERATVDSYSYETCRIAAKENWMTGRSAFDAPTDFERQCYVNCKHDNGTSANLPLVPLPDGTQCSTPETPLSYCAFGVCVAFHCSNGECTGSPKHESALWQSSSACQPSCIAGGRGIRLVHSTSKCASSPGLPHICGEAAIKLCIPDQVACPSPLHSIKQFADMVCADHAKRVPQIGPWGIQLPPVPNDSHRSCMVACRDAKLPNKYYKLDVDSTGWFPSGTFCGGPLGRNAYCVQGKCVQFGDDSIARR